MMEGQGHIELPIQIVSHNYSIYTTVATLKCLHVCVFVYECMYVQIVLICLCCCIIAFLCMHSCECVYLAILHGQICAQKLGKYDKNSLGISSFVKMNNYINSCILSY